MKINMLIGILILGLLTACAEPKPTLTPLQLQSMQTRQFSSSVDRTFASTVSVFQDLGYSITSADKASGLISAALAKRKQRRSPPPLISETRICQEGGGNAQRDHPEEVGGEEDVTTSPANAVPRIGERRERERERGS